MTQGTYAIDPERLHRSRDPPYPTLDARYTPQNATLAPGIIYPIQRVQGLNLTATHRTEQPSNAEFNVVRNKFAPALPHGHRVLLHLGVDVQLAKVAELLTLAVGARVPQQSDLAEGDPAELRLALVAAVAQRCFL